MNNYENDILQIPVSKIKEIIERIFGEYALDDLEEKAEQVFRSAANEKIIKYISVYEITRYYGGPEEGGWYYDHYDLLESVELTYPYKEIYDPQTYQYGVDNVTAYLKAREITDNFLKNYLPERFEYYYETIKGENETKTIPHYE